MQFPQPSAIDPGDPRRYLVNLALVFLLARVLSWHYLRFSPVVSSKRTFARVFPILAATSMLVSLLVQISPVLSLGIVAALTLTRFRTPIKEPEELAYLFLAIAVGLGMGADEWLTTFLVFAAALVHMTLITRGGFPRPAPARLLVHVSGLLEHGSAEDALKLLLGDPSAAAELRRVETRGSRFAATFRVEEKAGRLDALTALSQRVLPGCELDVVPEGPST